MLLLADEDFVVLDKTAESKELAYLGSSGLLLQHQSWQQQDKNWSSAGSDGELEQSGEKGQGA